MQTGVNCESNNHLSRNAQTTLVWSQYPQKCSLPLNSEQIKSVIHEQKLCNDHLFGLQNEKTCLHSNRIFQAVSLRSPLIKFKWH